MAIPRTFSNILNPGHSTPSFEYIWDPTLITTGGNQVITGGFRAFTTADISNTSLNVSGLNLTVGAVTLTGTNPVTVQNASLAVVGVGGYFGITGTPNVNVTNSAPINVTGIILTQVTGTIGGTVQVNSVSVTGNPGFILTGASTGIGFISIDTGVRAVNITSQSIPLNVTGNFSLTGNLTVGSVQVTGFNSGSALGSLDVSHTYLPVSGVNFSASVSVTSVAVTGGQIVAIVSGNNPLFVTGALFSSSVALTGFNPNLPPLPVTGNVGIVGNVNTVVTDPISWGLLSGISGALTTNLNAAAFVTGQVSGTALGSLDLSHTYIITSGLVSPSVSFALTGFNPNLPPLPISGNVNITNTAPINVTGIVLTQVTGNISTSVTNPIGVTGTKPDIASFYSGVGPYNFVSVGGRAVSPSGLGSLTGQYQTGNNVMLNFDYNNGALITEQGVLNRNFDEVTSWVASTGTVSNSNVSGIATNLWGTPLAANPNRRAWYFQNTSTGIMYLKFGTLPNSGSYNVLLKGGTTHDDGNGASYSDAPAIYQGTISVTGYFSITPSYVCWEL